MSKLLMIYERDMPTVSTWRITLGQLAARESIECRDMFTVDVTSADIEECDIILSIRPNDRLSYGILKKARDSGRLVISFFDDDLMNLPPNVPIVPHRKRDILRCLQNSDIISSSSQYILSRYAELTAGGRVLRTDTAISDEEIEKAKIAANHRRASDVVRIVYAAAPGHVALFNRYVLPVFPMLEEKYRKRISFTFVSVHPDLAEFERSFDIEYVKGMPLLEYREFMLKGAYDIGLAPINDDSFSKCKYFNKFLEYSTQGVVGVYSNLEPYTFIVKNGKNGFLADNTPESWYKCLSIAIEDAGLRKIILENALIDLKNNFSREKVIDNMIHDLPELISFNHAKKQFTQSLFFDRVLYYLSRPFDRLYLSWFYLKHSGVSGFIAKFKTHMRERDAYSRKKTVKEKKETTK